MKIIQTATPALLVLALAAPLRAEAPALDAPEACRKLEAQARELAIDNIRCEAGPSGLVLWDVSAADLRALQRDLFPDRRYLGHAVIAATHPSRTEIGHFRSTAQAQSSQLRTAQERLWDSPVMAQAVKANFDNSASHPGLAFDVDADAWGRVSGGPPGSGGGPPGSGRSGPPGSGGGPPGSRSGPPGSGGRPPSGRPPSGGAPPSRPAPVWRDSFPPPAPDWWNTSFDHYDWWDSLPPDYGRPYKDQRDSDTFLYYSGWHPWRDVFATSWVRTQESAAIKRTPANQDQIHSRSLTSQVYRDSKACYYQAVYRYDWHEAGFNGSHWEESFDHYEARCIRLPREYGEPRVYTVNVAFDMSLASGQDLPWDSDVIRMTYDGTGRPRYDFSGAAYRYSSRLEDQRAGGENMTLIAGDKILREPESDKVQAFLRVNAGKVEFVINDDRAYYYQGETLRVSARVIRRVVTKKPGWFQWEKTIDTVIHDAPLDIVTAAHNPQSVTDLTGPASAPKPDNVVRSSVFIESWEFSRVNSRISAETVIRQGQGNSVAY